MRIVTNLENGRLQGFRDLRLRLGLVRKLQELRTLDRIASSMGVAVVLAILRNTGETLLESSVRFMGGLGYTNNGLDWKKKLLGLPGIYQRPRGWTIFANLALKRNSAPSGELWSSISSCAPRCSSASQSQRLLVSGLSMTGRSGP